MTQQNIEKFREIARSNKMENENMINIPFNTLGDKAKLYIDKLFEDIKQGSLLGKTEYIINDLPQEDFVSEEPNTLTKKIESILKYFGLSYTYEYSDKHYLHVWLLK